MGKNLKYDLKFFLMTFEKDPFQPIKNKFIFANIFKIKLTGDIESSERIEVFLEHLRNVGRFSISFIKAY